MAYVPPHRSRSDNSGDGSSSRGSGDFYGHEDGGYRNGYGGGYGGGRGGYGGGRGGYGGGRGRGYGGGYGRRDNGRNGSYSRGDGNFKRFGQGTFVDGVHRPAPRNEKLERELYGDPSREKDPEGINFDNYDEIPVEVSGDDALEPIEQFTSPPIDELLMENIELSHFTKPTPVQKYSIPIVGAGRDLMACAQTGSGKTGGFLFPVLSSLFKSGPAPAPEEDNVFARRKAYPSALVLAPTRELAIQNYEEGRKFAYRSWVRVCVVYGGSDINSQLRNLERGCDLLVATPGRLNDMLERGRISLRVCFSIKNCRKWREVLPLSVIDRVVETHNSNKKDRFGQRVLAMEMCDLIHGDGEGYDNNVVSKTLYSKDSDTEFNSEDILRAFKKQNMVTPLTRKQLGESTVPQLLYLLSNGSHSKSEFRRKIQGNAVYLGRKKDDKIESVDTIIEPERLIDGKLLLLRAGKEYYIAELVD